MGLGKESTLFQRGYCLLGWELQQNGDDLLNGCYLVIAMVGMMVHVCQEIAGLWQSKEDIEWHSIRGEEIGLLYASLREGSS